MEREEPLSLQSKVARAGLEICSLYSGCFMILAFSVLMPALVSFYTLDYLFACLFVYYLFLISPARLS